MLSMLAFVHIRLLVAALVALLPGTPLCAGELFSTPDRPPVRESRYREVTAGDQAAITAMEWDRDGGLILQSLSSGGEEHTVLVDRALHTVGWRYERPGAGTAVEAVLVRDRSVRLTGTVAGEPVAASVRLTEDVWIQSIERSLEPLAIAGAPGERLRFSVVQPDTLSARSLEATVMGDETVEINGTDTEVRRIRISLPGLGVLIWRSNYWFRISDGLFIKSDVTRGPPGTPATIVTLLETDP